jgi:hypothetical protein
MTASRVRTAQTVRLKIEFEARHRKQVRIAGRLWGPLSRIARENLRELVERYDLSISSAIAGVSLATAMLIHPTCLPWSTAPKCGWPRPGRSTGPCAGSSPRESRKIPPQPVNGKNGNYGGPKVRDRLCQLIRQHQLDANLVKSHAVDFCGTKTLREASREQVEAFVTHLADWAEKDRNALLCQLNSYPANKEGAA